MKWITLYLLTLCFPTTRAYCKTLDIKEYIKRVNVTWIVPSIQSRIRKDKRNSPAQVEVHPTSNHKIRIPSALWKNKRTQVEETVQVVASMINSTLFQRNPWSKRRNKNPQPTVSVEGTVLGGLVLFLKVGNQPVNNLTEPIQLIFKHNKTENSGTCVFWQEDEREWSTEGCYTTKTEDEFICSCDHLSFFAVLVNPEVKVDEDHAKALSYITYVGSVLSAFFAFISLFIYVGLQ